MAQVQVSVYLCLLLRHHPELIDLEMDKHGWVSVDDLITNMNEKGEHKITFEQLEEIVRTDNKGRYRFNEDKSKIKACQGHSLTWVEPELEYLPPPKYLYHGTTTFVPSCNGIFFRTVFLHIPLFLYLLSFRFWL